MTHIPKTHPRVKSLLIREKLVDGFDKGLVAKEGLLAHGRGEAFDYLLGEKTTKSAKNAIKTASALLLQNEKSVISVNGNFAALCPKEIVQLGKITKSKIEVNLFYSSQKRKRNIVNMLKKAGAKEVLGIKSSSLKTLSNLDSKRRFVDKDGIFEADVVLVPLEDGDRTIALKKAGKKIITFDLNPLSRTAQSADITIVDNVTRGMILLITTCKMLAKRKDTTRLKIVNEFDNRKNLKENLIEIRTHLSRRLPIA